MGIIRPCIVSIQHAANCCKKVDYQYDIGTFANNTYLGINEMEKEQQTVEFRMDSSIGDYHHYLVLTFNYFWSQLII